MYTLGATPKKVPIFLLLFFSFVLGCQYVFLTPPWQAPDEITHYEYIDILSRAKLFQIRHESDYVLQRRIINSMDRFNAWNYVFRERPSPMPKKFWGLPLYGGSNTKLKRPPLYYILGSFVLKIFGTDDLLLKHYSIRLFSLLLSLLTLFFVYKAAKIIFPDDPYLSLTATCLVAFLPEFLIMSSAINSDSLANLIGAAAIYLFLLSLADTRKYSLLLFFPLVVILGLLTGRTTFFIVPSLVVFGILFILKSWKQDKRTVLFLFLGSVAALVIGAFLLRHISIDLWMKVTTNISGLFTNFGRLFQRDSYAAFTAASLQMMSRSFWYYSGWNAFSLPQPIYTVLIIFSLLGILGSVKYLIVKAAKVSQKSTVKFEHFILLACISFFILTGFLLRLMASMDPVGRYTFPALSAFAILLVIGLKEFIPTRLKKIALSGLIILLVGLNVYAIYSHLIQSFYYRFW